MLIQNAHSIKNKVDEIRLATKSCPFQIIALFETWLSEDISDSEHFNKRYNVYRGDRTGRTSTRTGGGGVLVAVDAKFNSRKIVLNEASELEHVCVKISMDACNMYIFAVYIRSKHETEKFLEFAETVKLIPYEENDIVIVCGDFNQPGIKWIKAEDGEYYLPINVTTDGEIAVVDTMLNCGFHQMCNLSNEADNVLDLVFTNKFYEISLWESSRPLRAPDDSHKVIELEIIVEGAETDETGSTESYSYKSADYEAMNAFFDQHETLSTINRIDNLENAFDTFSNVVRNAVNEFVAKVRVEKSTDPQWYTKDLKHLNNIRRKEYSRAKESKNFDAYNVATDAFMQLQGQLFESYINRIQSQIKSDPKHFWRFVNDRRKRNELPSVIEYNNETASTDESKAQLFAEYFKNQYTTCDGIDLDELLNECSNDPFEIEISEPDVLKALQSMKVNKGSGPDGISPHILKNCAQTLAKPLSVLLCKSLEEGIVPDSLKTSRIRPVFKSGSKNNAVNYRPIVIIPTIAKVFETVIYDKIGAYVNGKVIQNQHGFVKNRSTTTNLMQTLNYTFEAMSKKQKAIILYTDFEKAFDRVNHKILLEKLARFGFGRTTVKWFHAYLTSRNQFVGINRKESRTFAVTSGVPAGSILGPCLFIIFINDITDSVTHALVVLFADDLKLILKIASYADIRLFQSAIDQLYEWCVRNKLYLNLRKCFIMWITRTEATGDYEFTINNGQHRFEKVNVHRDLGVLFDSKLNFIKHIQTVVASAKGALGFIKRTLKNKFTIASAKMLYFALVRSKLEFASVVWQPYHDCYVNRIESVQKDFVIWSLRAIFQRDENYRLPEYELRCKYLKIQTLLRRRINDSIFLIYDLLLGNLISNALRERIDYTRLQYDPNQRILRNTDLIRMETFRTDYVHYQPFYVACRNFNKIRQQFFESCSRAVFRKNVIRVENSVFV